MEKIKLIIAGEEYNIATDDDLDYVAQLGAELDKRSALCYMITTGYPSLRLR